MPSGIALYAIWNYLVCHLELTGTSSIITALELPTAPPRITQYTTQNYLAHHLELPSTPPRMSQHITQNYQALHLECPSTSPRITQHSTQNALVRHLELPRTRSWNSLLVKRAPRQKPWKLQREKRLRKSSGRLQSPVSRFTLEFFTEIQYILREAAAATNIFPLRTAPPVVLILSCLYQPLSACSVCSYTDRQVVQCTAGRAKKGGERLGEATEGAVRSQRIYSYILCGSL